MFRAYHAMMGREPLTTSDGRATQAVLGMLNMLRSLVREYRPIYIAIIMDAKGKTFRHDLYSEYKANRPPMPPDLRYQKEYLEKIIPAMGLPLISISGVEADDVIGTLAVQGTELGFNVVIVSSDKDLAQLVNNQVVMVDTMKNLRLDPAGVEKKFGVPPHRIVEYLSLVGDTADNIPGIPKVGPKTAVKWLNEFGDLDTIIANASRIKGKVGEYLSSNLHQLPLSKELATVKCDVALTIGPDDLKIRPSDIDLLKKYYTDLELNSLLRELGPSGQSATGEKTICSAEPKYETILDNDTLSLWINKLEKSDIFAIDTETTSIDPQRASLVGLSFAVVPGEAAYLPLNHTYAGVPQQLDLRNTLERLRGILENPTQLMVGQNLKYDATVLKNHGITLAGIAHDTMLLSYVLDAGSSRHDMGTLAKKYLGKETTKFSDITGTGKNQLTFDQIDLEQATNYAAEDADITLQLYQVLSREIAKHSNLEKVYSQIEIPLMKVLITTESNGVKIDDIQLRNQSAEIAAKLTVLEEKAHELVGRPFNMSSPLQIQEILYNELGLPVLKKTPKGQPSTAENVLQELAINFELPQVILDHRGLAKLKSTYTDKLPDLINPRTGRIHTSYHQAVASTGRLSSSDPNLQNIPVRTEEGRRIREAFIAAQGNLLLAADYSQIELRIMAHLSEDKGLVNAFQHNIDVHTATAAEVFGIQTEDVDMEHRRRAKAINFGLIYGMSAYGLARQLKIEQKKAKTYMEIYFDRYPGVKEYMETTKQRARDNGFVETLFGRRLKLPEIHSKNSAVRQYAERTAINAPMQGTAADLIKLAMIKIDQWLIRNKSGSKLIMQVHDELVFEVPKDEIYPLQSMIRDLMCDVTELRVPLVVDIGFGPNWITAH